MIKDNLNPYSIIASIAYGLLIASSPTPEVVAIIGYTGCFTCAASFCFLMYCLFNKYGLKRMFKGFLIFVIGYTVTVEAAKLTCMKRHNLCYQDAQEIVAQQVGRIGYYLPFLP